MKDFKQIENGDLDLSGGDIAYIEASQQHQRDIILTRKGELKHAPDRGVGAADYFNDDDKEDLLRSTRQQMIRDGIKVLSIEENNGRIEINGYYESDYNQKRSNDI